eukprot:2530611-Amphidinium_carterae.2
MHGSLPSQTVKTEPPITNGHLDHLCLHRRQCWQVENARHASQNCRVDSLSPSKEQTRVMSSK